MVNIKLDSLTTKQIARLSYTLLNRLDRKMSTLTDAIDRLNTEVGQAVTLIRGSADDQTAKIAELQNALVLEREAAAALAVSEDSEDQEQNDALEAAQAEVDRLTGEIAGAVDSINAAADRLDGAVPNASDLPDEPEAPAPAEEPTEEPGEPVVEPVPAEEAPSEPSEPAEPATDSPAPSEPIEETDPNEDTPINVEGDSPKSL